MFGVLNVFEVLVGHPWTFGVLQNCFVEIILECWGSCWHCSSTEYIFCDFYSAQVPFCALCRVSERYFRVLIESWKLFFNNLKCQKFFWVASEILNGSCQRFWNDRKSFLGGFGVLWLFMGSFGATSLTKYCKWSTFLQDFDCYCSFLFCSIFK